MALEAEWRLLAAERLLVRAVLKDVEFCRLKFTGVCNKIVKLLTLKAYSQFKRVLYKGSKAERSAFVFFCMKPSDMYPAPTSKVANKPYPHDNLIIPKFGFIASRKQFKKAVDRNRAKRRIRAALQETLRNFNGEKSNLQGECVFILRKPILSLDFLEIKKSLGTVC